MIPGEYLLGEGEIEANAGRRTVRLTVANTGDRPIQVGSHFHFFEANRALRFERAHAFGMRLDIAAGTTAFAGGVSVNPSSVSVSAQAAPAAPPVNWRVGLTTTTPHYVLDCRQ